VAEDEKTRRSPQWLIWLPRLWTACAAAYLLWQSVTYRGISALAAEWQFSVFGSYRPALTYLCLVLFACLPLLALSIFSWGKRGAPSPDPCIELSRIISQSSRNVRNVYGAAITSAAAAIIIAVFVLFLPSAAGPEHQIVAGANENPPPTGPTVLRGTILYDRISVFKEDFVFANRSMRFAPVVGDSSAQGPLRYFVELSPESPTTRTNTIAVSKGVLRRGGLPGEIVRLYQHAGYHVAPDHYVLFASDASMRREYVTNAIELLSLACFIFVLGGFYTVRHGRLRKDDT
jgi:hypothetical protein